MNHHDEHLHDHMFSEDQLCEWDAAYALGSLSAQDRRAYEEHLRQCPSCAGDVGEFVGLNGALGSVSAEQAFSLLESRSDARSAGGVSLGGSASTAPGLPQELTTTAPSGQLSPLERSNPNAEPRSPRTFQGASIARLGAAAARRKRNNRWRVGGLVAAAVAATAALAFVLPSVVAPSRPDTPGVNILAGTGAQAAQVAMQQNVVSSPVEVKVWLDERAWGTNVRLECDDRQANAEHASGRLEFGLYVQESSGAQSLVATWNSGPGDQPVIDAATALKADQIASVQIRRMDTGTVLFTGVPVAR